MPTHFPGTFLFGDAPIDLVIVITWTHDLGHGLRWEAGVYYQVEETMSIEIGRELCDLLDEQMKAIAGRGFEDLTPNQLAEYKQRRTRIATLLNELGSSHAQPSIVSVRRRGRLA